MTSILTSSKNDPNVFCSTLHGLSNAVYRFSMRCVVLEISGGGAEINPPPPAGSRLAQTPAGARVKVKASSELEIDIVEGKERHFRAKYKSATTFHEVEVRKCHGLAGN